jgi:DNA repair protein RecO (recombination protein O)
MSAERRLEGLVLRSMALGETDRLLTLLSDDHGLIKVVAPGARKPKSSLAAAVPLAQLQLQLGGRGELQRVRQLQVLRNFAALAERLETLAAAQGLAELVLQLAPAGVPLEGALQALLLQLNRLEAVVREHQTHLEALAISVQASVQLLAIGGYALPLASCARSGTALEPPLGQWEWRCSLLASEGFVLGAVAGAQLLLNPSELALLQRLLRPALPRRRDGALMGPEAVWLRLLQLQELWCREHLGRSPRSWRLLRQCYGGAPSSGAGQQPHPPCSP